MTPIVLHHGFCGYDELRLGRFHVSYFNRIDRALAKEGYPLIVTRVHPTAGIETRALQLKQTILDRLQDLGRPRERVLIVAHSMGGLDARHMISRLGMENRVAGLLTICTPHRGTSYADWCVRHLGRRLRGLRLLGLLGLDLQGAVDLTTERCARFNEQTPDAPQVRYASISAKRPLMAMPPYAMHSCLIVQNAEGENDGLVSVRSARWGAHWETWPADHWRVINKHFMPHLRPAPDPITPRYLAAVSRLQRPDDRGEAKPLGD